MYRSVITYGTFDLFHIGHVRLLSRISQLGEKVFVGVSTDEFNFLKGKKSVYSFSDRCEILESCKYVHEVFPESNWEQKENDIFNYNIDLFVIGDDWTGKFDYLKKVCDVIYLPRTKDISTSMLKSSKNNRSQLKINFI